MEIISKLRNFKYAEDPHEMMESPMQEAQEHMPGGYEEGAEGGEGEGDMEQILSQLSPEELEQLASELSGEMQTPEAQPSGEEIEQLAQAIQENLAQNPEASPEGLPPEKAAALSFVKSASYIEGFLNEAVNNGVSVKHAVDLYDSTLTQTINNMYYNPLNKNAAINRRHIDEERRFMGSGPSAPPMPPKTTASDLRKMQRYVEHAQDAENLHNLPPAKSVGQLARALQYLQGMSTRNKILAGLGTAGLAGAGAYGLNRYLSDDDDEPEQFKAASAPAAPTIRGGLKQVGDAVKNTYKDVRGKYKELERSTKNKIVGGAGLTTGVLATKALSGGSKEKEAEYMKIASYCEGLMEQAIYNGFTPKQAEYFAATAFEDIQKHAQITEDSLNVLNHFLVENSR